MSTSLILKRIKEIRNYHKIKDPLERKLYILSDKNNSTFGKISALITFKGKIIASSGNIDSKDLHAEIICINEATKKKIPLNFCKIYILISPCIMCSKKILLNKIPEVYYLNSYGNDDGIKLLRKNSIKVLKYKPTLM